MDEKKYLNIKMKIKRYRMGSKSSIIVGILLLAVSFPFVAMGLPNPSVFGVFVFLAVFLFALSIALIILGIWAGSHARNLEIGLEVYDKRQDLKKGQ